MEIRLSSKPRKKWLRSEWVKTAAHTPRTMNRKLCACTCHRANQIQCAMRMDSVQRNIPRLHFTFDKHVLSTLDVAINAVRLCSSGAYIAYHEFDFNIKRHLQGMVGLIARSRAAQVCFK